jgi:type IV pilus assembly protein PilM
MSRAHVVAIDCGASRIAVSAFTVSADGGLVLDDFASIPQPVDTGEESAWIDRVALALGEAGGRKRFPGRIVLSLPPHHTLLKFVKAPHVDASKRDKIVQFEAQQNIPYPLNEVVWDKELVHDDGAEFEVVLAAAKLDLTESLCAAVARVGFEPERIEPASLGLHRLFRHHYPDFEHTALLIDIGARSTILVFSAPGRYHARTISLAGNTVTAAIAEELQQPLAAAERLKISALTGQIDLPPDSPTLAAVERAVQGFATKLALEITRSIVNYRRQTGTEQPAAIRLTGGGALIGNLAALLAERLRTDPESVDWFEPLGGVTIGPKAAAADAEGHAHLLTATLGLALGEALPTTASRVDLLPPRVKKSAEFRRQQPKLLVAAALAAGALLLPAYQYYAEANAIRRGTTVLEREIAPLRATSNQNRAQLDRISEIRRQIDGLQSLVSSRSNWINFFADLQVRLSEVEDVWLDRLQVTRTGGPGPGQTFTFEEFDGPPPPAATGPSGRPALRLILAGRLIDRRNPVSKVSQDSYNRVNTLLSRMKESEFIERVENERFDNSQPGILRFDFTMVIDPAKPL